MTAVAFAVATVTVAWTDPTGGASTMSLTPTNGVSLNPLNTGLYTFADTTVRAAAGTVVNVTFARSAGTSTINTSGRIIQN